MNISVAGPISSQTQSANGVGNTARALFALDSFGNSLFNRLYLSIFTAQPAIPWSLLRFEVKGQISFIPTPLVSAISTPLDCFVNVSRLSLFFFFLLFNNFLIKVFKLNDLNQQHFFFI